MNTTKDKMIIKSIISTLKKRIPEYKKNKNKSKDINNQAKKQVKQASKASINKHKQA